LTDDVIPTATEPIPPEQPSDLHRIFIGKDGLRAGWSLLIFITLVVAIVLCIRFVGHKLHPPAPQTDWDVMRMPRVIIGESIPFLVILLVSWIMSKIERRPNSVYGLGGSRKLARFFAGLAWGVTCLSLLVLTLLKTGYLVFDSRLLFGSAMLRYGAFWLFSFLLVGLLEEYLTRGYLQYTLSRGLAGLYQWAFKTSHSPASGFWTAAIFFSILFGLGHSKNPGESPIGLLTAGLAAMVFCFSLWRTGSLWWAIGFHTSWDWAQSFLYGVADSGTMIQHHLLATHPVGRPLLSGGDTGPEGSIFAIAMLALVSLIILFTLPRTQYDLPGGKEPR
jgi:membrane protease YdiL (CAAX protease family)